MKIAIVINTSWNIFNFRKGLVQALIQRGDEVVAVAPYDNYTDQLIAWGCVFEPIKIEGTGMNPAKDLLLLARLRKILRKTQPEIVLTYTIKPNLYGSIAAGSLGIPCICNVSGLGTTFLWTGIVRSLAIALYNFGFRYNKWVFFQNEDDQREFLSLIRLDRLKTSLLPGSGIDTHSFLPKQSNVKGKTVFLMISRLIIEKGVHDYIEAIRLMKSNSEELDFYLVGGLDEAHARSIKGEELEQWVDEGLIKYIDHLSDVRPLIEQAHVVVLPSYREGTPRTLLEGGAMGKVLLASDVPGCREVVKDGYNGFLFEKQNPESLAGTMRKYLSLSAEVKLEMAKNSRDWIEQTFDQQLVIDIYLDKIEDLTVQL